MCKFWDEQGYTFSNILRTQLLKYSNGKSLSVYFFFKESQKLMTCYHSFLFTVCLLDLTYLDFLNSF